MIDQYPENWPDIAYQVKERAGWHCEHCHHLNEPAGHHVLTVHHINGIKADCSNSNLVALCQRCHLYWQARLFLGQAWLFPEFAPAWIINRGLVPELKNA